MVAVRGVAGAWMGDVLASEGGEERRKSRRARKAAHALSCGQLWARILLPTRRARLLPTWNDVTALTMAAVSESDTLLTPFRPHTMSYDGTVLFKEDRTNKGIVSGKVCSAGQVENEMLTYILTWSPLIMVTGVVFSEKARPVRMAANCTPSAF